MTRLLLIFLLFTVFNMQAQEEKIFFSEALSLHLKEYNKQADHAIANGDIEYAKSLFDSLIKNHLQGTFLDNLKFEGQNTSFTSTEDWNKPTVLLTYESWCIPNEGEIPALNKLANQYSDLIDFVVLYWDSKSEVRKRAKQFDKNIQVVYVDDSKNQHMQTVKLLKHALGLSLSYVISANKEILDINRRPPNRLNDHMKSLESSLSFMGDQLAAIYLDLNLDPSDLEESIATF